MKPNLPIASLGPEVNPLELQNYVLFVMNFYELHMSNLKNVVLKQTDTIQSQKKKIRSNDDVLRDLKSKFEQLDHEFRTQGDQFQKSYDDLRAKHESTLEEVSLPTLLSSLARRRQKQPQPYSQLRHQSQT
jgi:hypothetical protein